MIALSAQGGIDLTPVSSEFIGEGIKYQQLTFRQDKQRIEYYPPPGWSVTGTAERVRLTPPKKNFAEAAIETVPLKAPQPLDEKNMKELQQRFIASLPPTSQFVTVVGEEPNPVPLSGNPTFEVTASYQLMGEKFVTSSIFANLTDTQLVFRLTARKDDFEALHRELKRSVLSWHWVEPAQAASTESTSAAAAPSPQ